MGRRHIPEESIVYSHRNKNIPLDTKHSPVQIERQSPTNENK